MNLEGESSSLSEVTSGFFSRHPFKCINKIIILLLYARMLEGLSIEG